MSNALGGWQAFGEVSEPDALSTRGEAVQLAADTGLADLAELFPAARSFSDILSGLNDKQAGTDKWADLVENLFEATGTTVAFDHDFALGESGGGLGLVLDQLWELLGNQTEDGASSQIDLQPLFAGTVEGGTASGSPVGFNQALVNQLDSDSYWFDFDTDIEIAQTITFGFTTNNSFAAGYGEQAGWSAFASSQKDATREIMGLWDDLIAPSFVEETNSPNTADIKFSNSTTNTGYAHAYYPGQVGVDNFQFQKIQGSVWLNPTYNSGINNLVSPQSGIHGYTAIAHEIGHALGLNHAGNYNGGSPQYGNSSSGWLYEEDSTQYTIMSYFNASNTGADWNGKYAQTPMVYDILAIQQLYGADYTTRATDTTYGFNATAGNWIYDYTQNTTPVMTIWDGDGTDTIDLSGWSTSSTLSLVAGSYSSVNDMTYNLAIAYDVDIENAIGGSGDDTLDGNDLDNVITGNAGNDTINGHRGNDTLYGGEDNDTLNGGDGNDWLEGGDGVDRLFGGDGNDTIVYDAADDFAFVDGGDGFDTLLFYDIWQNIDLTAYNFEQSQVQTTDTGSAAWDIQTDVYDLNGNLFERRIVNDNGTSSVTVYDVYDVETWSEWIRDYNAAGDQINETFIDDGSGGSNTAATIGGDDLGAVTEDASSPVLTDSGTLTISDPDAGEVGFTAGTVAGTYGSVSINAAGNWTYTASNNQSAVQALAAGATLTDTITVSSVDGTTHDISVTITGVNDAAVIAGDDQGSVTEDATSPVLTDSGTLTISDVDAGQAGFVAATVAGTYGAVSIDATGNWTYTADNNQSAIQALGAGATLTDIVTVSSVDGTSHDISIIIQGVDEEPPTGEDPPVVTGTLGDDYLPGTAADEEIYGLDGNDWLTGGAGNDRLFGGAGHDVVVYDAADDFQFVQGGEGFDTLFFHGSRVDVDLAANGFERTQLRTVDTGNEYWSTLVETFDADGRLIDNFTTFDDGTAQYSFYDTYNTRAWGEFRQTFDADRNVIEEVFIADPNTSLVNGGSDNLIEGTSSGETIDGTASGDVLLGYAGNDILNGNAGNDWLNGGAGNDRMFGGSGNDTIVFDAADDMQYVHGGDGFDTLFFRETWQDIDLEAHGFEVSQLRRVDTGNEDWASITETYDSDGLIYNRYTSYDDGTASYTIFDSHDAQSWNQLHQTFDASGNLIDQVFL